MFEELRAELESKVSRLLRNFPESSETVYGELQRLSEYASSLQVGQFIDSAVQTSTQDGVIEELHSPGHKRPESDATQVNTLQNAP